MQYFDDNLITAQFSLSRLKNIYKADNTIDNDNNSHVIVWIVDRFYCFQQLTEVDLQIFLCGKA